MGNKCFIWITAEKLHFYIFKFTIDTKDDRFSDYAENLPYKVTLNNRNKTKNL